MTVGNSDFVETYDADGVTTRFPYPHRFDAASDVRAEIIGIDGARRAPEQWDVTGDGAGATFDFLSEIPAAGETVVLYRRTALLQQVNYQSGDFPSATHEQLADRLTMAIQERAYADRRALRLSTEAAEIPAIQPFEPGRALISLAAGGFGRGPNAADIADAQGNAAIATAAAARAELFAPAYFRDFDALMADRTAWGLGQLLNTRDGLLYRVVSVNEDFVRDDGLKLVREGAEFANAALLALHKIRMRDGAAVRITCFGDSITAGAGAGAGPGYPGTLQVFLQDFYQNEAIELVNAGVGGDSTRDLINRYGPAIGSAPPDIVCLMIGMNDSAVGSGISPEQYGRNLDYLLAKMRADGCAVLMADITPRKRVNNDGLFTVDAYRRVAHAVAAARGVEMIPMHAILTDLVAAPNGYSWTDLSTDGIHYNSALGYRQIAGAWMAYGLASEPLALRCGQEKDMIGAHVVSVNGADFTYARVEDNAANAKEAATLRYTAISDATNMRLWLWVEDYRHSDLVLYLTREANLNDTPALVVRSLDLDDVTPQTYALGFNANGGATGRAVSVPLRVARLGPGLNIVNMRVGVAETAEFAKFAVRPCDPHDLGRTGVPGERFSRKFRTYSSPSGAQIFGGIAAPSVVGSAIRAVGAGQRVFLGLLDGDPHAATAYMARYVLRGRIRSGTVLEVIGASSPGREHKAVLEFRFTSVAGPAWKVEVAAMFANGAQIVDTATVPVASTSDDVRLTFYLNRSGLALYVNSDTTQVAEAPFAMNTAALVARNDGTTNLVAFNPMVRLESGQFNVLFEGDAWIDFNAATRNIVVGGNLRSAPLTVV